MSGKIIQNHGYIAYSPYLDECKTSIIIPRIIHKNGYEFPNDFSSISHSKRLSFVKSCSEMYERQQMGVSTFSIGKSKKYYLKCKKSDCIYNEDKGYGYSKNYGYCDSTGTACGFNSDEILLKAICELIEKNEAMIFWYLGIGEKVDVSIIEKFCMEIKVLEEKIYVFIVNELSNAPTAITFIVNSENKIVSTGVSAALSEYDAITNSINEAILLSEIYKDTIYSPLSYLTQKEQDEIYNYIVKIMGKMDTKKYISKIKVEEILFANWIKEIEVTSLNKKTTSGEKIVKVLSCSLMNCLPKKDYVNMSKSKTIFEKFNILEKLEKVPECIIL